MFARLSTYQSPAEQITDAAVEKIRAQVLPSLQEMDGFRGVLLLMDRESGKQISVTLWESEDALRASEEKANSLRKEAAKTTSGDVAGVEKYYAPIVEMR